MEKAKLTLWIPRAATEFGKRWTKRNHASISELVAGYLNRLEAAESSPEGPTPAVKRLSKVIMDKTVTKEAYKRHLLKKYSDA